MLWFWLSGFRGQTFSESQTLIAELRQTVCAQERHQRIDRRTSLRPSRRLLSSALLSASSSDLAESSETHKERQQLDDDWTFDDVVMRLEDVLAIHFAL